MLNAFPKIAAGLCRLVETLQANPVRGLVLFMLGVVVVAGLWAVKH